MLDNYNQNKPAINSDAAIRLKINFYNYLCNLIF